MHMTYKERIEVLRYYELECYHICHFILKCEQLALITAQEALLQLLKDEEFYIQNEADQFLHVKKVAKKAAIHTYLHIQTSENNH
jgi:hypothetical protein